MKGRRASARRRLPRTGTSPSPHPPRTGARRPSGTAPCPRSQRREVAPAAERGAGLGGGAVLVCVVGAREGGVKRPVGLCRRASLGRLLPAALLRPVQVHRSEPRGGVGASGPPESTPWCRAMQFAPALTRIRANIGLVFAKRPLLVWNRVNIGATCRETQWS